jgi:hypothetical protein
MADNNFRSDRSRDPLAELARLIGQGDPYAEGAPHQSYGSERPAPAASVDWAAEESYTERHSHVDERYPAPPAPAASHQSYAPQEQGYENDAPAGSRYFAGPAAQFNGFREETDPYAYDEPPPLPAAHQLQGYASAPDHGDEGEELQRGDDAYAADDYYDEAPRPRRRSGLVVAMAIFGLAVVGTAGAFGYRAMFGGSVLPTLPPIIKASNGPNRVAPAYGDGQANNANDSKQAGAATTGSTENLVSREEQPVTIEPPRAAPRVVSTIPIITGQGSAQNSMPAGLSAPATTAVPNQAAPGHVASAADSPWPPPPPTAAPPVSAAPPMPVPAPPQVSSEPKKIHTVTIRADQSGGTDAAPASTAPAALPGARPQSRAATAPRVGAPPSGPNAPMSIVPGSQGSAPAPQRTRMTAMPAAGAPTAAASANSPAAAPSSGGSGYSVQVTSQRSEGEAQTAFRALQAKYPNQLSGRAPIIRRADLGDKGTFYRALVGPFASAEEAAGLCSGLKAAGGNCIVQRN